MRLSRVFACLIIVIAAFFCTVDSQAQGTNNSKRAMRKLSKFLRHLEKNYVDEVDLDNYVDIAIESIVSELDPFSEYMSKEKTKKFRDFFNNKSASIGVGYMIVRDTAVVVRVLDDSPAFRAGVRGGDRIVAVNGRNIVGADRKSLVEQLSGAVGESVSLDIYRSKSSENLTLNISYDNLPTLTVYSYRVNESVGYIQITNFTKNTAKEFYDALEELSGVESLILDLSNNTGGDFMTTINIAGAFLPDDALICYAEGRKSSRYNYYCKSSAAKFDGNLVVMINEHSASASEILAGALQDWDRALVVGRRSLGKGLGQYVYNLDDGSSVKLSIANFYTPSGRCIQRQYEMGNKDGFYQSYKADDSSFYDASVYQTYKSLIAGRTLYSGNGIAPDIFIEGDSRIRFHSEIADMLQLCTSDFVVYYLDKYSYEHPAECPTCLDFISNVQIGDEDIKQFTSIVSERAPQFDISTLSDEDWGEIFAFLINNISWQLYPTVEFRQADNQLYNAIYEAAVSVVLNWDSYSYLLQPTE